jgi:magnesium transporter
VVLDARTYGELTWIDVVDATDAEYAELARRFRLHALALEDITKFHQRPKLERYPDHGFLVAKSAGLQEVDVLFGDGWLVTVRERDHRGGVWDVAPARARFEKLADDHPTVGFLLWVLLDTLVDDYFATTEAVEDRIETLEARIFDGESPDDEHAIQELLFDLRRELLLFRRAVVPLRDVVAELRRDATPWVDAAAALHLQDVHDHVLRVVDALDTQREILGNAVDAHLAIISNRMNLVMKRMTSWGAILVGATLIAGIYGMNFAHMPELGWRYGYAWALGLMAALTVGGYWYFRRKDWL